MVYGKCIQFGVEN